MNELLFRPRWFVGWGSGVKPCPMRYNTRFFGIPMSPNSFFALVGGFDSEAEAQAIADDLVVDDGRVEKR